MQQLPELSQVFFAKYCVKSFFVSLLPKNSSVSKCPILLLSCILYWIESSAVGVVLVYDFKDEATCVSKITLTLPPPL